MRKYIITYHWKQIVSYIFHVEILESISEDLKLMSYLPHYHHSPILGIVTVRFACLTLKLWPLVVGGLSWLSADHLDQDPNLPAPKYLSSSPEGDLETFSMNIYVVLTIVRI